LGAHGAGPLRRPSAAWALCGMATAWVAALACNTAMYGTATMPLVSFLQQNVLKDVGALYGVHPPLWCVPPPLPPSPCCCAPFCRGLWCCPPRVAGFTRTCAGICMRAFPQCWQRTHRCFCWVSDGAFTQRGSGEWAPVEIEMGLSPLCFHLWLRSYPPPHPIPTSPPPPRNHHHHQALPQPCTD
jgi:hypothetical protein